MGYLTATHGQRWEEFNPATGLYERGQTPFVWYAADGDQPECGDGTTNPERWRPSTHMPRWACRLVLEITDVRVERLQDISRDDAVAEGVETWAKGALSPMGQEEEPQVQFAWLCGPDVWSANPWVWVIEFRRLTP